MSATVCAIAGVTSNEPAAGTGDGDVAPDWLITGALTLEVRSERAGKGTGRIYSVAVACRGAVGNVATGTSTVTVPHDNRK